MRREVVLDTETTGLDPAAGHRICEIAAVELVNHVPTGRQFSRYCNPERDMPAEAFAVHGLSEAFLRQHPTFAAQVDDFLAFIDGATLIIHNAEFDLKFLNAELERCGRPRLVCAWEDTVLLARRKFPGAPASLDALCRRFEIDLSEREKHGALVDCRLLASVYLELIGGRQPGLLLGAEGEAGFVVAQTAPRAHRAPRPHTATDDELAQHAAMVARLKDPLWADPAWRLPA